MSFDFLKSRAFWSALGPFVAALCILLEVSEAKTAAIVSLVTAFAGFWTVTAIRAKSAEPRSYAEVMRVLWKQQKLLSDLRGRTR